MATRLTVENDQLVADLRDALRDGRSGLSYVPKLLTVVLERGAWRERVDERGEPYSFATFDEFVRAAPLAGLGATPDLIDRIVGTDDPELLVLLRKAKKRKVGRPKSGETRSESEPINSETADYGADRLARDAPAEFDAVRRGEKSIHKAAVDAGIRRPRVSVRVDDARSAARTLRRHMAAAELCELGRLLLADEG